MKDLPTELFGLNSEQEAIVSMCRRFATEEIRPIAREVDEADTEVPWGIWYKASDLGLTSFMLPSALGGGGFTDVFTQCLVQEELCAGDLGIGNLLTSNGFSRRHGTGCRFRRRRPQHAGDTSRGRLPPERSKGVDLERRRG